MSNVPSDQARIPERRRTRAWIRTFLVLLFLTSCAVVLLVHTSVGEIPYRGGTVRIPLRPGSFRLTVSEGRARYVVPGPANIEQWLADGAPDLGWELRDQYGAIYRIVSKGGAGLNVVMVTEPKTSYFTQIDCHVEQVPETAGTAPPPGERAHPAP